jgi:hypothetical protein
VWVPLVDAEDSAWWDLGEEGCQFEEKRKGENGLRGGWGKQRSDDIKGSKLWIEMT